MTSESLQIIDSVPYGPVQAVRKAMKRLQIAELIAARPSPERNRVMAMIVARHHHGVAVADGR